MSVRLSKVKPLVHVCKENPNILTLMTQYPTFIILEIISDDLSKDFSSIVKYTDRRYIFFLVSETFQK